MKAKSIKGKSTKEFKDQSQKTLEELKIFRAELAVKNRELEIESSLERVRTVAMGMKEPADMLDVCRIISQELVSLGIKEIRNIQTAIIDEEKASYLNYEYFRFSRKKIITAVEYKKQKDVTAFVKKMLKDPEGFFTKTFKGAEIKNWIKYQIKAGQYVDPHLYKIKSLHYYFYSIGPGALGISTYAPLNKEAISLFKRFRNVFQLAYRRFIDIQNAETQAREAQIEASLEKVRAQALGMHKPDDLLNVCKVLFKELLALGFTQLRNAIIHAFNDEKGYFADYDYSDFTGGAITEIPYNAHPVIKKFIRQIKSSDNAFVEFKLTGNELIDWKKFRVKGGQPEDPRLNKASTIHYYIYSIGSASIGISSFDIIIEEKLQLLRRFRNVFDFAYRRYMDVAQAEAQARESQIQLALERVRARTMAMQKSDELPETSYLLFQQLKELGETAAQLSIGTIKEEEKFVELSATVHGNPMLQTYKIPIDEPFVMKKVVKAFKEKQKSVVIEIRGKKLKDYNDWRNSVLKKKIVFPEKQWIVHVVFFSKGFLSFSSDQYHPKEAIELLERFAGVFDLTYTRFLDLKNAEAQAKEARIELALERVRARAMAMQHSDELAELVATVFKELTRLDFTLTSCIIWIHDHSSDTLWIASAEMNKPAQPYQIKPFYNDFFKSIIHAWKAKDPQWIYTLTGNEKKNFEKAFFRELPDLPDALKKALKVPRQVVFSASFNNFGALEIVETEALTDEKFNILHRFGKVFDASYTRFNDLKKAEAQARESQIQLALERVRARTMAMQKSDELAETASLLFKQINDLGIQPWTSGFNIWEENDTSFIGYNPTPSGDIAAPYHIPSIENSFFKNIYDAKKRGEDFFVFESAGESLAKTYNYMKTLPVVKEVLRGIEDSGFQLPTFQINHCVFFSHGFLLFITLESYPKAHDIFKRFGKVFEQTYIRFLDLQKAEAQAREAKIEAALERVRAKAMAMHSSKDLSETISVFYRELKSLSITPRRCGVALMDKDARMAEVTTMNTTEQGDSIEVIGHIKMGGHKILDDVYENWLIQKEYHAVLRGNQIKEYYQVLKPQISYPDYPHDVVQYGYYFMFKEGDVYAWTEQELAENELEIYRRFTTVISLTYKRYKDLQKAEAQARESQIQLALERVRARTMAMQKSEELPETSHILFEQMKELGEPVEQLTIGVVQEENKVIEISATLHGDILKKIYQHSLDEPFMMSKIYHAWKTHQKTLIVELKGDELNAYNKYRNELTKSEMFPTNLGDEHRRIVYAAFFSKGMLALGANEPRPPESLQLLERFAGVFDQAYIRFIDLKNAEAQAREAQIEAALERVRSRTMAMHQTSELQEVIHTVHKELLNLHLSIDGGSFVVINDDVDPELRCWGSGGTANTSEEIHVPHFNMPFCTNLIKGIKKGPGFFTEEFSQKEKIEYFTKLFEHKPWSDLSSEQKEETLSSMDGYTRSVAVSKHTSIFIINHHGRKFTEAENDILKRFAKVFEQTYTRFLDLKKAEAQARESQIELGLERVRSRAMAMQSSEELNVLIGTVFAELTKLDLVLTRCVIWIFDPATLGARWWMANSEKPSNPMNFFIKYHEHPAYLTFVNEWKKQNVKFVYDLKGQDKISWDDILFNETELVNLPDVVKNGMRAPERVLLSASFNNFGGINVASLEPLSDEHFDILLRFAKVFDLTYTRFNDLKQAEAQARESQIQLALERVRARTMAMQKSNELMETAAVLFNQLNQLGENIERTIIGVMNEEERVVDVWATRPDGSQMDKMQKFPIDEPILMQKVYTAWRQQKKSIVIDLRGEELESYFQFLKGRSSRLKRESFGERRIENFAFFSKGILGVINADPKTPANVELYERFAAVFDQTYTRFLDLQTAEAQAREAKIEASLEKIRSRSLAMHKSDELQEVVKSVFERMNELNIELHSAMIIIFSEGSKDSVWWLFNNANQQYSRITMKYADYPYFKKLFEAKEKGKEIISASFSGEEKNKLFNYFFEHTDFKYTPVEQKKFILESKTFTVSVAITRNIGIHISSFSKTSFSEEENEILKRFAKVFDQSYTRFLDLQKAEAQAREAQIEAALERVRSKAMAMHKSEDLNPAVATVFEELDKLDLGMLRCGIGILYNDKRTGDVWTTAKSGEGNTIQTSGDESMDIHPLLQGAFDAWQRQGDFSYILEGEDLMNYYQALTKTNFQLPESASFDTIKENQKQFYYVTSFESGTLFAFREREFPEEAKIVMKRFASVFNLTYKRFLDLQKAEANAREAQIEAGLERVRARTMAMHSSDDVSVATATMFTELEKLGIENFRGGITNIFPNRTQDVWSVNNLSEGKVLKAVGAFNIDAHPFWQLMFKEWEGKKDFTHYFLAGPEKDEYIKILNATQGYLPQAIQQFPDVHFQVYYFNEGAVWTNSLQPHSEEDKQVMKKFTSVFSLTFRRYQDLKKAEAQTREAKIEAAMEKVRARAMAMQKADELIEVAELLRKEMGLLGVEELETSSIYIHNEETGKTECWYAIKDERKLVADHMTIDLNDTWVGRQMYEFYRSDKKQVSIVMQGDNRKEWINYCSEKSKALSGFYGDNIPNRTYHLYKFSNGYMGAASPGDISAESWNLLQRATSVFSLAYTRFNDLQLAEASAKEAIKQAALDRIRADIASMRKISDLDRITPLIWNELTILGVPFIRCGVFIMDEEKKLIHTFLSTPDGKAIGAFHLPYTTPGNIQIVLSHWHDKKSYIDHWDESAFTEFADILVNQGALASPEQYLKTIPHGGFYLHFLPFLQGMLYVGNTTQLGEEEIKLIQSVADAFSTAYARYEDFNKLEAAKKQVDSTLNELQTTQKQLIQSEKMASLGELTAGIAHEIQNPLNFVNNFSEVSNELLDEMITELSNDNKEDAIAIADDVKQNLEKILHHGKRADGIVKGMLQHSRSSSATKEPTDINKLADEYLRLAYHGLRAKDKSFNATTKTDYDETIETISIIPQDIGRAVLNLITNAFYTVTEKKKAPQPPKGGVEYEPTVSVSTKKINGKIEIKVADNGNGIPQKVLDKIFQPFFTTKPTGQGTGLGLSLSYDIVKAHGGEIKVETKEGKGSEFIIQLPV